MATLGVEFVLLPSKVALVPMTKHSFTPQLQSLSPSLFVSQFTRSAPILCFKRNFVLSIALWVCQPQIMPAILFVGVGLSLPFNQGFWCKLSRYWVTGIRTLFSFIFLVPLTIRLQSVNLFAKGIISHRTTLLHFGF